MGKERDDDLGFSAGSRVDRPHGGDEAWNVDRDAAKLPELRDVENIEMYRVGDPNRVTRDKM